jgi:hypothetical protein
MIIPISRDKELVVQWPVILRRWLLPLATKLHNLYEHCDECGAPCMSSLCCKQESTGETYRVCRTCFANVIYPEILKQREAEVKEILGDESLEKVMLDSLPPEQS